MVILWFVLSTFISFLHFSFFFFWELKFWFWLPKCVALFSFSFLQYNEILGKGASKTVYEFSLVYVPYKFLFHNFWVKWMVCVLVCLIFQVQGFWWVWRNWSSMESGEASWFPAKFWESWEVVLWNSPPQNLETWKYHEVLHFLGWYC